MTSPEITTEDEDQCPGGCGNPEEDCDCECDECGCSSNEFDPGCNCEWGACPAGCVGNKRDENE